MRISRVLLSALTLTAVGCTVDNLTVVGRPCGADADCGSGATCNLTTGRCIVKKGAAVDASPRLDVGGGDRGRADLNLPDGMIDLPLGQPCNAGTQCKSGHCADGVCCDTACVALCKACNLPGKLGVCSQEPSGNVCQASSCKNNTTVNLPSTCDAQGSCMSWGTKDCSPYVCDPTASACTTSCASDMDCSTDFRCKGTTCLKVVGAACTSSAECHSGYCFDKVCCDSECNKLCYHCSLPGKQGTCAAVPAGQDEGNDCNASQPSTCGQDGSCDGMGACRLHNGTVCAGNCDVSDGQLYGLKGCDGMGACSVSLPNINCQSNFTCDVSTLSCYTSCTHQDQCSGYWACDLTAQVCYTSCTSSKHCKTPYGDCSSLSNTCSSD